MQQTETPAALEFSNDLLKIKAHFKPACRVELEIEAALRGHFRKKM